MATITLLSQDQIRKHEIFNGQDEAWVGWSRALDAELAELGMKVMLDAAKNHPDVLEFSALGAAAQDVAAHEDAQDVAAHDAAAIDAASGDTAGAQLQGVVPHLHRCRIP